MPLESGTYISDLNASNPVGATDPKSQGDDHLRLIKSTILATFPNISNEMSLTHTQLNNAAIKDEANVFTDTQRIESVSPRLELNETGVTADNALWRIIANFEQLTFDALTDAGAAQTFIAIPRTGNNVDGVNLSVDGLVNLEAIGNGLARVRSAGSTDAESRALYLAHQDGTLRGQVGYIADGTLRVLNQVHGATVLIQGEDAGGTIRNILSADPDGNATLYYAGGLRAQTQLSGFDVFSDASLDTEQRLVVFNHQDGTDRAQIGHRGNADFAVRNMIHGGGFVVTGEDLAGVGQNLIVADPDGAASLYYDGGLRLSTITGGISVRSAGNTDAEVRELSFQQNNGTERGMIGHDGVATFYVRNLIHGEIIRLTGEDAGGTPVVLADLDPDGPVTLHNDAVAEFRTQDSNATGTTSGAEVKDHGATYRDVGFNLLPSFNVQTSDTLEAQHCGTVQIVANATAYTLTLAASSDLDFPVNGVTHIMHGGSVDYTVTEGATTTLYYVEPGTGRVDTTGGCTIGPGGVATIWRQAAGVYYIWGSEITYTP